MELNARMNLLYALRSPSVLPTLPWTEEASSYLLQVIARLPEETHISILRCLGWQSIAASPGYCELLARMLSLIPRSSARAFASNSEEGLLSCIIARDDLEALQLLLAHECICLKAMARDVTGQIVSLLTAVRRYSAVNILVYLVTNYARVLADDEEATLQWLTMPDLLRASDVQLKCIQILLRLGGFRPSSMMRFAEIGGQRGGPFVRQFQFHLLNAGSNARLDDDTGNFSDAVWRSLHSAVLVGDPVLMKHRMQGGCKFYPHLFASVDSVISFAVQGEDYAQSKSILVNVVHKPWRPSTHIFYPEHVRQTIVQLLLVRQRQQNSNKNNNSICLPLEVWELIFGFIHSFVKY